MRRIGAPIAGLTAVLTACSGGGDGLGVERTEIHAGPGRTISAAWSPDGSRLAYAEPVDGAAAIFVANADGTDRVRLTHGVWDVNPLWSPDGRWIAYHAESPDHDLWVVPSDGGDPRALTATRTDDVPYAWLSDGSGVVYLQQGVGETRTMVAPLHGGPVRQFGASMEGNLFASPSPDGRWAAIDVRRGGRSTIWVHELEGGTPRQLTTEGFENLGSFRSWSPDSRQLLYTSRRTGTNDLWVADVETGELRQLTQDVRNDIEGVWSPDGQWVAFRSQRGGQDDLWIVPAAGGQPRRVTADRAVETNPQWSPDGRSILFHRVEGSVAIHIVPADGGPSREIMSFRESFMQNMDLSPDGRTVLFQSNRSGTPDVWTVSLDGGEPTAIASSPVADIQPRWSPDGSEVAFTSLRGGTADIWVTSSAGGEARQLTDWPSAEVWPVWSPDGSTIAFVSNRDAGQLEVWTIPAAGGEATRLTHSGASARIIAWSENGREILYIGAAPGGLHDVYSVPATGGTPRPLGVDARIGNADLSPDGRHVAHSVLADGWGFVDVVARDGTGPRRLTPRPENVYQEYVRWSPDGSRLVVTDYVYVDDNQDLYVVTWPGGEWLRLTENPAVNAFNPIWTRDGRSVVFIQGTVDARVVSVNVANLLSAATGN